MILIVALTLLGLAANRDVITDIGIASNHAGSTKALYGAEAAADVAFSSLLKTLQTAGTAPTSIAAPSVSGYTIQPIQVTTVGSAVQRKLLWGLTKGSAPGPRNTD